MGLNNPTCPACGRTLLWHRVLRTRGPQVRAYCLPTGPGFMNSPRRQPDLEADAELVWDALHTLTAPVGTQLELLP